MGFEFGLGLGLGELRLDGGFEIVEMGEEGGGGFE